MPSKTLPLPIPSMPQALPQIFAPEHSISCVSTLPPALQCKPTHQQLTQLQTCHHGAHSKLRYRHKPHSPSSATQAEGGGKLEMFVS